VSQAARNNPVTFDPRLTPARADLAASHLRGKVDAPRYAEGTLQEVVVGHAPVRLAPSHDGALMTEALRGERVMVYEMDDEGWAWGQLLQDGYVGWLPSAALLAPGPETTHRVTALRTLVFPGPDIKLPPLDALPLGARIAVTQIQPPFAVFGGGHLAARHVAPIGTTERDFVAVAKRFVGVPYLWGGKTSLGIDCSGLVQVALDACGINCPRDSDVQERALGVPVDPKDLRRGDLIFWQGHVAIACGGGSLLHASAFHMQVAIEPMAEALERIRESGGEVTSARRLATPG
jgi:cell wall-associated NlpC family hydrolase